MSEFKTNKISPRSGTTQTIGDSGDSVSTSSGSTINNAGTITTAGITGGTINNTTGSIYLRGEVDWQPSDIKTASFTATDNQGFFVNTTSGQITVTLPASPSAGDVVGIKDYANTFDTNKCILNANGNKIQGSTELFDITVEGSSIIIIYVDATQGWVITDASKAADISENKLFITATGGTETTCGDYKIHTFTGPGTFCVSSIGNCAGGGDEVDYVVVAGGGGGGSREHGGGGGAGGFRESHSISVSGCYTASPLATPTGITITATAFPITVGGGGSGGCASGEANNPGTKGADSIFSTITSTGGGLGQAQGTPSTSQGPGGPGGSGGGGGGGDAVSPGGSGNTPPVSPPQGNSGGGGGTNQDGGAGGGAATSGGSGCGPSTGGNGVTTSITGSAVARAGGGGGGNYPNGTSSGGTGGGAPTSPPNAGTVNTGGGGGGGYTNTGPGGSGGSGIVIIRYKFQ